MSFCEHSEYRTFRWKSNWRWNHNSFTRMGTTHKLVTIYHKKQTKSRKPRSLLAPQKGVDVRQKMWRLAQDVLHHGVNARTHGVIGKLPPLLGWGRVFFKGVPDPYIGFGTRGLKQRGSELAFPGFLGRCLRRGCPYRRLQRRKSVGNTFHGRDTKEQR